jgi:hypothetical protein
MSDKRKDDAGVLGSLPATRPTGLRAERSRDAGQGRPAKASNGRAGAKSRTRTAARTKSSASQKAAAGAKASTSQKAAAKPTPKAAGKPRAVKKTTTEPAPSAPAAEPTVPHRPRPVRAGAPALAE